MLHSHPAAGSKVTSRCSPFRFAPERCLAEAFSGAGVRGVANAEPTRSRCEAVEVPSQRRAVGPTAPRRGGQRRRQRRTPLAGERGEERGRGQAQGAPAFGGLWGGSATASTRPPGSACTGRPTARHRGGGRRSSPSLRRGSPKTQKKISAQMDVDPQLTSSMPPP